MLKVVHLNTYDGNGGAGKACLRLNRALLDENIDSKVIVHYKFSKNTLTGTFDNTVLQKGYTAARILLERILGKRYLKGNLRTPFSFSWFGRSVINHPDVKAADIIHLHWVNHSFLNPKHIAEIGTLNKPIVWTFHDSNAFTGGCHVRYTCDHYQHSCGYCPLLKKPEADDISNKIWNEKDKAYQRLGFTIVTPSSWMLNSILLSSLMKDKPIKQIPNTLNTEIFKPRDKVKARVLLGLPVDKFLFLTGFMPSRKDSHKGTEYLTTSLNKLAESKGIMESNIELVVFGNREGDQLPVFPFKTTYLGTIADEERLATCYAAADGFLIPSLEDNLPYTVMESLACGTPVVTFRTGGIPDMVQHKHNGYIANYQSPESFCYGMTWLYENQDLPSLQINARATVMENFSEQAIARKHINLYDELAPANLNDKGINV